MFDSRFRGGNSVSFPFLFLCFVDEGSIGRRTDLSSLLWIGWRLVAF